MGAGRNANNPCGRNPWPVIPFWNERQNITNFQNCKNTVEGILERELGFEQHSDDILINNKCCNDDLRAYPSQSINMCILCCRINLANSM